MPQTIITLTVLTVNALILEGVDESLTGRMGTLVGVVDGGFLVIIIIGPC